MKHLWALLIKFAATGTVLFAIFGIFNPGSLLVILFMAVATTLISYIAGDLYILPKLGNVAAIIGDFALTFGLVGVLGTLFIGTTFSNIITATFFASLTITAIEALFHLYVKSHVLTDSAVSYIPGVYREDRISTEFPKN